MKTVLNAVVHMARMQLQWFKDQAEQNLRSGRLSDAFNLYNGALNHCNMNAPVLQDEVPKLLSNRSLVLTKIGNFELALADAMHCIEMSPYWAKVRVNRFSKSTVYERAIK
jgi:hypothetical protein